MGRKGKLESSKSSKQSTKARKRQAEMSKIEKKVNEVAGKTSWNYQNHQNSQPRQGKDKLEFPKLKFQPFIYSYAYIYNIISGFYINFTLQENILTS